MMLSVECLEGIDSDPVLGPKLRAFKNQLKEFGYSSIQILSRLHKAQTPSHTQAYNALLNMLPIGRRDSFCGVILKCQQLYTLTFSFPPAHRQAELDKKVTDALQSYTPVDAARKFIRSFFDKHFLADGKLQQSIVSPTNDFFFIHCGGCGSEFKCVWRAGHPILSNLTDHIAFHCKSHDADEGRRAAALLSVPGAPAAPAGPAAPAARSGPMDAFLARAGGQKRSADAIAADESVIDVD